MELREEEIARGEGEGEYLFSCWLDGGPGGPGSRIHFMQKTHGLALLRGPRSLYS